MMYLSHWSLNFACRGQSWICLICSLIHGKFELSAGRPTRGTLDTLPVRFEMETASNKWHIYLTTKAGQEHKRPVDPSRCSGCLRKILDMTFKHTEMMCCCSLLLAANRCHISWTSAHDIPASSYLNKPWVGTTPWFIPSSPKQKCKTCDTAPLKYRLLLLLLLLSLLLFHSASEELPYSYSMKPM